MGLLMSLGFGDIDLNSDVANGGVHGVDAPESTVGFDGRDSEGLGSAEEANGTGAEMGRLERESDEKLAGVGVGGQIGVNDSAIGLGLNCNLQDIDTFHGVSTCSGQNNEGLGKNCTVSTCSEQNNEGLEKNCSVFSEGTVVGGKSIYVAAVSGEDIEIENVKQGSQVKEFRAEKEGQFRVSDLVWAKVKSHPWWPGQIFDPSDASEKARRYSKKDGFLIAFFGDKTFAWNEAPLMKPFQMHFSQMEKQGSTEAFSHAVNCALEEVSRRVEFGLGCSCLSPEVYDKIKTQIVVNSGIHEESSRRDGGDESSSAASFMPVNLLQNVKTVAQYPYSEIDRLESVTARAQLLAISRWRGFYCLPEFQMLGGGWLEDGADIPIIGESKYSEDSVCVDEQLLPLRKGKLVSQDASSRKRKISGAGVSSSKKERCLSDLMSRSRSNLSNGVGEQEVKVGRYLNSSSSVKKRKALDSVPDVSGVENKKVSPSTKKQCPGVGESMCRVANQLAMSSPIVKDGSGSNKGGSKRSSRSNSEKSQRRKVIPTEHSSPDEMLSQIYMASRDPVKGYNFLASSVGFLSEFRNSFCLEKSTSRGDKKPTGKVTSKKSGKNFRDVGTTETPGFGGTEDSYWTDMIVQSNTEEQVLFEPEIPKENGSPTVITEATLESGHGLELKQETEVINPETGITPEVEEGQGLVLKQETEVINPEAGITPEGEEGQGLVLKQETEVINPEAGIKPEGEEEYTPTALKLNFADLESVPSESNLNAIFSRYGPLIESDTEVLKKSKRAKVVFKRRSDAETAFSSSGKFSTFGPSLVSYRLLYLPSTPRKSPTSATKRSKKGAKSVEGNGA
ncbi:hypothetical protein RHMOL_Rhmol05G0251200 [Rhododendron molle]|uniref:Uncharacterized protein n=1 Tax=Rhododendron molle TaxID=49168 RepID=A0ACC0NU60_RHOML|nr:hypothetical protein RHMOL_Rhmol05G0251200 [Rhododendron molle]